MSALPTTRAGGRSLAGLILVTAALATLSTAALAAQRYRVDYIESSTGLDTSALDVNDDGVVAGSYTVVSGTLGNGFVWSEADGFTPLAPYAPDKSSGAWRSMSAA